MARFHRAPSTGSRAATLSRMQALCGQLSREMTVSRRATPRARTEGGAQGLRVFHALHAGCRWRFALYRLDTMEPGGKAAELGGGTRGFFFEAIVK